MTTNLAIYHLHTLLAADNHQLRLLAVAFICLSAVSLLVLRMWWMDKKSKQR